MLLRDHMHVSGGCSYKYAIVHLSTATLYFEIVNNDDQNICGWFIPGHIRSHLACTNKNDGEHVICESAGEFEAQAVLDHYVSEYGLLEKVT